MDIQMFSVIIPTLGYSPFTLQILLRTLAGAGQVAEILLINNSGTSIEIPPYPKLTQVLLPSNVFVNAAWNLGERTVGPSSEWLVFLNDDILIPANTFDGLTEAAALSDYSVVGTTAESISALSRHDDYSQAGISIRELSAGRPWGFGVCMLVRRQDFMPIPEELKIWCGDDFLIDEMQRRGKRVGVMDLQVRTQMSTSSGRPEFQSIRDKDLRAYRKICEARKLAC